MNSYQEVTCSAGCAQNLREDRRHGLIYGPYGETLPDGKLRLVSHARYAGLTNRCIYCATSPLPRGRVNRLLAKYPR
jgi:hypothetical protein